MDGIQDASNLGTLAKERGMSAVALTDHGSMAGIVDFVAGCRKAGVKPLIGNETYLAFGTAKEFTPLIYNGRKHNTGHFLLIAKNAEGYRNLLKITEYSNHNRYGKDPIHDLDFFCQHAGGLIATSTCLSSHMAQMYKSFRSEDGDQTLDDARRWCSTVIEAVGRGNFFFEVQKNNVDLQRSYNDEWVIPLSKELDIPLVLTADAHYSHQDQWKLRGYVSCLAYGKAPHDPTYPIQDYNAWLYPRSHALASCTEWNIPAEAVTNTKYVADLVDGTYFEDAVKAPLAMYNGQRNEQASTLLRARAIAGLLDKFKTTDWRRIPKEYKDRFELEFKLIDESKYSSYFLTVQDYINLAKSLSIPVGPGRGSGPGSVIVWALGISGHYMDPVKNHLYFERFLNPGRVAISLDYINDI